MTRTCVPSEGNESQEGTHTLCDSTDARHPGDSLQRQCDGCQGLGRAGKGSVERGAETQFARMKIFWSRMVVMVIHLCECT